MTLQEGMVTNTWFIVYRFLWSDLFLKTSAKGASQELQLSAAVLCYSSS